MDYSFSFAFPALFVHLATLCYVLGLLTRKELILRGLLMTGSIMYIIYYANVADRPLWEAITASTIICASNLPAVFRILRERTTWGMSPDMLALYAAFPTLNPGEFRRLMKLGETRSASEADRLCSEGEMPDALYLTVEGSFVLVHGASRTRLHGFQFLGEISFLLKGPASATVVAEPGARYVRWERARLERALARDTRLSNAITALLNRDIARKLSRSFPLKNVAASG